MALTRISFSKILSNFKTASIRSTVCSGDASDIDSSSWNLLQNRYYWNKKRKVPRAPYTKPVTFYYAGDATTSIGKIDYSQPKPGYENLPELESADDAVKKIFSLEYSVKSKMIEKVVTDLTEKIKEHPLDVQSLEYCIARDTVRIRNGIEHCVRFRHDKVSKMKLVGMIGRRNRELSLLQQIDMEKFNWLSKELQVSIVPKKEPPLTRREQRQKAARDVREALMQQKVAELRKRLSDEKQTFDEYRKAELADIEQSLEELGLEMKSLDQTLTDLGASELAPKPVPWVSLEDQMKQRKIAQLMELKKKTDAEILRNHGFVVPKSLLS